MMADDWQLEAVHEQFKFFESLTTAHTQVHPNEIGYVINKVNDVIQRHLRVTPFAHTSDPDHKSIRQISATIISNSTDDEIFQFAFILIVTDTDVHGSLCTLPLFAITSRNKHVFVDVNCNVYNSWSAFMKSNDLPQCKFCFPVDGKYSVGRKLKIDFAKSPAASWSVSRSLLSYGGICMGVAVVAISFFFNVPKYCYSVIRELIPLANKFIDNFQPQLARDVMELSRLVQRMRRGSGLNLELSLQMFRVLANIYSNYQNEIKALLDDVLKLFGNTVRRFLDKHFNSNSTTPSCFEVLAITNKINNEVIDLSNTSKKQLVQAQRVDQYVENVRNEVRTTVCNNKVVLQIDDGISSALKLFEDCRNESACSSKYKSQIEPLSPVTVDLLKHSARISESIDEEDSNATTITDILLGLNDLVQDKYKSKVDTYTKSIKAARAAAGHEINLDQYNKSLGIEGDPEHHFWSETFQEVETNKLFPHILKAIQHFKKKKKLELIPFNKGNEGNGHHFYKCIGIHRDVTISTPDLVSALKDLNVVNFNEKDLVLNETKTMIFIRSSEFTAILLRIDEEPDTTSSGFLYLKKE